MALATAAFGAGYDGKLTALDRYVQAPDHHYRYELVKTVPGKGYTGYVLGMTSIDWRSAAEVDRPVWKHWLTIVKPDSVEGTTGFLSITQGHINDPAPAISTMRVENALTTHTVVSELYDVPNEPVTFLADGHPRTEGGIESYTWVQFLKTGDETWPLEFSMAKAAIRAMDTVTNFCAGQHVTVEKFFVTGASKRGWTTWMTAAADQRVIGIAPVHIDLLNNKKSYENQYRSYGFFSPAVHYYQESGIMDAMNTAEYAALQKLVDPYSYRERFTMPKFIVNSSGDQFYTPDSSRFYFDDLPGEKYLRYAENADHSGARDAGFGLIAFYDAPVYNRPRPKFFWKFEDNGNITVSCADKPTQVKLWQATNPAARDFRLMSIGKAFKSRDLADQGGGVYVAKIEKPDKGWTASFVELEFPSGCKYPFKFSTAVRITPDTLPYPPLKPSGKLPK
jgi:PhoPQ-activated pathogenicity-related protein